MKYAVLATGGKQYKVLEGKTITVERVATEPGKEITFDKVLLYAADGTVKVGMPMLDGVTVTAEVVEHVKGDKIRVSKFKAKARYRKVTGHRQSLSKVKITAIGAKQSKKAKADS